MIKIKGLLRGIGIGLILASLLLSFQRPRNQVLNDEEIRARAKELGMVTQRELLDQNKEMSTEEDIINKARALGMIYPEEVNTNLNEETNINEDAENRLETSLDINEEQNESVTIRIEYGMTSESVANLLLAEDIIDDMESFLLYFIDNNLTKKIRVGIYEIEKGSSFEDIGNIITNQ
jgi:hypothetical protein